MTVVIADTSPLNYLILIDAIEVLPQLYGKIIIPSEVLSELINDGAPCRVSEWAMKLPEWVEVRSTPLFYDPTLSLLDHGERCAILLAQSEEAWNVKSDDVLVQQPPGAMNKCIGGIGPRSSIAWDGKRQPPGDSLGRLRISGCAGSPRQPLFAAIAGPAGGPGPGEYIGYGRANH